MTQSALHVDKIFNEDGSIKQFLSALKTEWIRRLVYLDGKPFNFDGRGYLYQIYNTRAPRKLLMTGRQVEKTTLLANEIIINSVINSYYKSMYVSPSFSQTRAFSNQKLRPWIQDSPIISKYFVSTTTTNQVLERAFTNGSMCFLRSAFLSADRCRGLSTYLLCLDEVQDLLTSNIPVIEECLSHAPDPVEILSGTPKHLSNAIQTYWNDSSQCEWLVPCEHHSPVYYNYLDDTNVGLKGPICKKCGKPINPAAGRWVAFSANRDIMAYRISQLMVPWYQNEEKWKSLVWKKTNLSKGSFFNECLGISYDSASKPITRTELVACCSSQHPFHHTPNAWTNKVQIFAGIDWGEGSDGTERGVKGKIKNASYTVLTLGMYLDMHHFYVFYYRRFTGKDALPGNCINEIIRTCMAFRVVCIGADWGHGWGANERIEEAFGLHRVIKFQHLGNQRQRKKYDEIGHKFQLARTEVMTDLFTDIKDKKIVWPEWDSVKDYLCDFENIYSEYNESTRQMKYDHQASNPDDAFHSTLYCYEAAKNFFGKN